MIMAKTIDTLGIVHHRLVGSIAGINLIDARMAACGFLDPDKYGKVSSVSADTQVTCVTCLVRTIEIPGCMHEIHGAVHACPFALRPGHEGPGVRCHCCPECTAECAVDPCDQSCCLKLR